MLNPPWGRSAEDNRFVPSCLRGSNPCPVAAESAPSSFLVVGVREAARKGPEQFLRLGHLRVLWHFRHGRRRRVLDFAEPEGRGDGLLSPEGGLRREFCRALPAR